MPKLSDSLFCTIFESNNKNPMGFKFSDPVFPCFWLLKDLIAANYIRCKRGFANIFTLTQDTSTKLETKLDLDDLHYMT